MINLGVLRKFLQENKLSGIFLIKFFLMIIENCLFVDFLFFAIKNKLNVL